MVYSVAFHPAALRQLEKLGRESQRRIVKFLESRAAENPREKGAALTGELSGYWKYRIGDYRAVCEIQDSRLLVLVVKVGHRSDIYRR